MSKKYNTYGREFQDLAIQVNQVLANNEGLIGDQKEQVELVFALEQKFIKTIRTYQQTVNVYKKFIEFIISENGNILSAKPYFRETGELFNAQISNAIKKNDPHTLMKFNPNFQLIDFIVKNWKGQFPERPKRHYDDFLEARRVLIENNIPLAINRAKKFYRKTPKSHLTLLDLIGICIYGLTSGVDKYVGEYTKVWRSVCIGRMVGYMIEEYSKTFLRMYPVDKKILYRTNALKFKHKIEDVVELTKVVNESFKQDKKDGKKTPKLPISEIHIRTLLNGSSYISTNQKNNDDEDGETQSIYDHTPDEKVNTEDSIVKKDLLLKVLATAKHLTVIERKIIRLKGVDL